MEENQETEKSEAPSFLFELEQRVRFKFAKGAYFFIVQRLFDKASGMNIYHGRIFNAEGKFERKHVIAAECELEGILTEEEEAALDLAYPIEEGSENESEHSEV